MTNNAANSVEAQIALLNETMVQFTAEAFEEFCASIDAPIAEAPEKMRERLSRPKPWDITKSS